MPVDLLGQEQVLDPIGVLSEGGNPRQEIAISERLLHDIAGLDLPREYLHIPPEQLSEGQPGIGHLVDDLNCPHGAHILGEALVLIVLACTQLELKVLLVLRHLGVYLLGRGEVDLVDQAEPALLLRRDELLLLLVVVVPERLVPEAAVLLGLLLFVGFIEPAPETVTAA
jgi:hypothetical protein